MQAKSKELHHSFTESALVLSGAAALQAEVAAALYVPELGLLKMKRSLDLLHTRVRENLKSAAASAAQPAGVVTADLDCKALAAAIRTSGEVTPTLIMTDSERQTLRRFLGEGKAKEPELKLLYRGSRDGFDPADFHRLCDDKGPTVTVVQTPEGAVFGGFAAASWRSLTGYVSVPGCFLFTLRSSRNLPPQTFALTNMQKAMYCHRNGGPIWGDDLFVAPKANAHSKSYSNLGTAYALPAGCTSDLLAGAKNFTLCQVEVFGTPCALSCHLASAHPFRSCFVGQKC